MVSIWDYSAERVKRPIMFPPERIWQCKLKYRLTYYGGGNVAEQTALCAAWLHHRQIQINQIDLWGSK